jgi:TonB family protein
VKLDSAGNLKELQILEGSPLAFFDQVVIESWKKIRQFPNPPAGLKNPSGEVITLWNFTVEIGEGQSWSLLPPRRI